MPCFFFGPMLELWVISFYWNIDIFQFILRCIPISENYLNPEFPKLAAFCGGRRARRCVGKKHIVSWRFAQLFDKLIMETSSNVQSSVVEQWEQYEESPVSNVFELVIYPSCFRISFDGKDKYLKGYSSALVVYPSYFELSYCNMYIKLLHLFLW